MEDYEETSVVSTVIDMGIGIYIILFISFSGIISKDDVVPCILVFQISSVLEVNFDLKKV